MQSANLCKVQIYAKCKFMQSTKLGMVQNYAKFETSKHVTKYFKSETYKQKDFTVQSLFDADMQGCHWYR